MNHAVSGADAVLEVELSARELLAINQSREPGIRSAKAPARASRLFPRVVAGLGAAACFAVLAAMLVSHRTAEVEQRTPVWIAKVATALPAIVNAVVAGSEPAATPATVVKFANPFDRTEIFEFPAGMSAEEAQGRVAEILLQRAQERVPTSQGANTATERRRR
jgi:hypothetical protein